MYVDGDDGYVASEVGDWAKDKHLRLNRYVTICSATRKKYLGPNKGGAVYIDLYCGPGKSQVRETGEFIDGGAVVAARAALESDSGFSEVHIADIDEVAVEACRVRLEALGVKVNAYCGDARDTVHQVLAKIPEYSLNFAFLDPYSLDLPFAVIRTLGSHRRMDILAHVSIQDLQRNLRAYAERTDSALESFTPGWREYIDLGEKDTRVRAALLEYWKNLVVNAGLNAAKGIELVSGSKNQHLYWLILLAKHTLAEKFWNEIRTISPQGSLDL